MGTTVTHDLVISGPTIHVTTGSSRETRGGHVRKFRIGGAAKGLEL